MRAHDEVFWRLAGAGYTRLLRSWSLNDGTLMGLASPAFLEKLQLDDRFASGIFYGFHRDVGQDLIDFRSHTGVIGPGSLQIVIDKKTLAVYVDIDEWSPYADVVGFLGHTGEVIGGVFRKLFRRNRGHESSRDGHPSARLDDAGGRAGGGRDD